MTNIEPDPYINIQDKNEHKADYLLRIALTTDEFNAINAVYEDQIDSDETTIQDLIRKILAMTVAQYEPLKQPGE